MEKSGLVRIMEQVRDAYESRVDEIGLFFDFLEQIIDRNGQLSLRMPFTPGGQAERVNDNREVVPIQSSVVNTLKANGFLLLYNLVESTIRQTLKAIHRQIDGNDHCFDDLQECLQKYFLKLLAHQDIRADCNKKVLTERLPIVKAIIRAGFEVNKNGGNISFRTIKELGDNFGFEAGREPMATLEQNVEPLRYVKDKRNELAHGEIAFLACGSITSIDELNKIKTEIVSYLAFLLDNVEQYIESNGYLAASPIVVE